MAKARAYCFTVNNYTADDEECVRAIATCAQYTICGKEVGEECGTPHLQGYVYFANQRSFRSVSKALPRARLCVADGTAEQNRVYCTKQAAEPWLESGVMPTQGKRNDIEEVRAELRAGKRMRAIVDTASSMQSIKVAEAWLKYNEPSRKQAPEVRWYYGVAEAGKSRAAERWLEDGLDEECFRPVSFKWWEGYDAHKSVLIDDMRKDWCKYHELLKLLDRYPHRVECKNGSRQLLATRIAITAPMHPSKMYKTREDLWQLLRRIHLVVRVNRDGSTEEEVPRESDYAGASGPAPALVVDPDVDTFM